MPVCQLPKDAAAAAPAGSVAGRAARSGGPQAAAEHIRCAAAAAEEQHRGLQRSRAAARHLLADWLGSEGAAASCCWLGAALVASPCSSQASVRGGRHRCGRCRMQRCCCACCVCWPRCACCHQPLHGGVLQGLPPARPPADAQPPALLLQPLLLLCRTSCCRHSARAGTWHQCCCCRVTACSIERSSGSICRRSSTRRQPRELVLVPPRYLPGSCRCTCCLWQADKQDECVAPLQQPAAAAGEAAGVSGDRSRSGAAG